MDVELLTINLAISTSVIFIALIGICEEAIGFRAFIRSSIIIAQLNRSFRGSWLSLWPRSSWYL